MNKENFDNEYYESFEWFWDKEKEKEKEMDKYHKEEKNWCDICYEPINEMKRVCGMCADNRVADGIWTEEEKNEKMYKENK